MRSYVILLIAVVTGYWQRPHHFAKRLQWSTTGFHWHDVAGLSTTAPSSQSNFYNTSFAAIKHASSSQLNQDIHISEYFNGKRHGFFIDLAANHFRELSNTYFLEQQYDWNGICIEPNPTYFNGILEHRKCILVTNPISEYSSKNVSFNMNNVYGGIVAPEQDNKVSSGSQVLTSVTLNAILLRLHAPPIIEYFSLDVEGGEFDVLKHFDFGMFTFLFLGIERPQANTHNLLVKHGYWFMRELGNFGEEFYIHSSMDRFDELMMQYKSTREEGPWGRSRSYLHHPVYVSPK